MIFSFCLSMISSENRFPLFRIMLEWFAAAGYSAARFAALVNFFSTRSRFSLER
jgi:hypothetical protein